MEVKINREIRNYTESMFFGLPLRQFIFSLCACAIAVMLFFLLKPCRFKPNELGEYISAMSNAAAIHGRDNAFFIWGINDENHEIVGTNFDYKQDIKREPL